jgi:hypothetical protein
MVQRKSTMTFEDISLEQTHRMSPGPRMDPDLYNALKGKIQSVDNTATRMTLLEGIAYTFGGGCRARC